MVVDSASSRSPGFDPAQAAAVRAIIARYRGRFGDAPVYVFPDIPGTVLNGALAKYARSVDPDDVLLVVDTSVRGNGKMGMLLTAATLHGREPLQTVMSPLSHIGGASLGSVAGSPCVVIDVLPEAAGRHRALTVAGRDLAVAHEPLVKLLQDLAEIVFGHDPSLARPWRPAWSFSPTFSEVASEDRTDKGVTLRVDTDATFRPGARIPFTVIVDSWPDPKVIGIDVELGFHYTHLKLLYLDPHRGVGTPLPMLRWLMEEMSGEREVSGHITVEVNKKGDVENRYEVGVVDTVNLAPAHIDDTGSVNGHVTLPKHAPATLPGVITWLLRVRVSRKAGSDPTAQRVVNVGGMSADMITALRPRVGDDWLIRAASSSSEDSWEKRIAAVDRHRDVSLRLDTQVVEPGGVASGEITVTVDPSRHYRETHRALTQRGRRQREDAVASMPDSLEVQSVSVALECWRGSEERSACHLVFQVAEEAGGPMVLSRGAPTRIPFQIAVPETGELSLNSRSRTDAPIPATLPATALSDPIALDDLRWRIVARVIAEPGQFAGLPGVGGDGTMGYSGDQPSSALWAAAEVVLARP